MAHPRCSWDRCLVPFSHDHLQSQLETVVSLVFSGPPAGCCVNSDRVMGRGFTGVRNVFWSHCDSSQGHLCYIVGFFSMTWGPYTFVLPRGVSWKPLWAKTPNSLRFHREGMSDTSSI